MVLMYCSEYILKGQFLPESDRNLCLIFELFQLTNLFILVYVSVFEINTYCTCQEYVYLTEILTDLLH